VGKWELWNSPTKKKTKTRMEGLAKIALADPLFKTYAVCSALLVIKMVKGSKNLTLRLLPL
jgi:hypothetical protein